IEADDGPHQQDLVRNEHQVFLRLNSDPSQASTATAAPATSFQKAARNATMAAQKPFFVATAAAPPRIRAASPYSAILTPCLHSPYSSPEPYSNPSSECLNSSTSFERFLGSETRIALMTPERPRSLLV